MPEESTTSDLVELTRRSLEAWNSGDLDGAMSMFSPNPVWDATGVGLAVYEGHAEIREYLAEWIGLLDDLHFEPEEIVDSGHGIIFAIAFTTGRMKGSSGELDMRWAAVAEWADDLIMRVAAYTDIDQARAAAERLAESRA
jgi:ketosteroid isomerase-like protein